MGTFNLECIVLPPGSRVAAMPLVAIAKAIFSCPKDCAQEESLASASGGINGKEAAFVVVNGMLNGVKELPLLFVKPLQIGNLETVRAAYILARPVILFKKIV